jgi:hypothetical protein
LSGASGLAGSGEKKSRRLKPLHWGMLFTGPLSHEPSKEVPARLTPAATSPVFLINSLRVLFVGIHNSYGFIGFYFLVHKWICCKYLILIL